MKGISPLIASVLLIAFTVAIATLVMGWFSTLTRSTTSTVSNKTSESIECSNAQIGIQDIYITAGNTTTGSARVIVKNNGFKTIGIISLQIYNTTGHNFSSGFSGVGTFAPGSIRTFSIENVSVITCPTTFSKVIVTSNCGGIADVFDGAPKCQ